MVLPPPGRDATTRTYSGVHREMMGKAAWNPVADYRLRARTQHNKRLLVHACTSVTYSTTTSSLAIINSPCCTLEYVLVGVCGSG